VIGLGGWAAILSAVATLGTFVTGILFFSLNDRFGWINDLFSVLQVLLMVPLVMLFDALSIPSSILPRIACTFLGLAGMLITAFGQISLLAGKIDFEGSGKYILAGGAIGLWLIAVNLSALNWGNFPAGLLWLGAAAGLGYLITLVGFVIGGQESPIFYGGGLILGVCYPIWGIWLGRLLLAGLAQS
jgi:hypothetical protein